MSVGESRILIQSLINGTITQQTLIEWKKKLLIGKGYSETNNPELFDDKVLGKLSVNY